MTVQWQVTTDDPKRLKEFLKAKNISRRIIGRTKFHGGSFVVNGKKVRVREPLEAGDEVILNLPIEKPNPNLKATDGPLAILYEDEHYLIINKPADLISVPSPAHTGDTVASRVKGYYLKNNYRHQVVHIVTRLDRYTSGVMLIAKNTLAHSLLGKQLDYQELGKHYEALVEGHLEQKEGLIDAPIGRAPDSIIERIVDPKGKPSITEFKMMETLPRNMSRIRLALRTGRTHQIRVHLAHLGHPLVGDDLYEGSTEYLNRQALHCRELVFEHPFTGETMRVKAPPPADMKALIDRKME